MPLTDIAVRQARPKDKIYTLTDGRGLGLARGRRCSLDVPFMLVCDIFSMARFAGPLFFTQGDWP